jgi:hypothetical protein
MQDPNMETALMWAEEIGPVRELPSSLIDDVTKRAELVNLVDPVLVQNSLLPNLTDEEKQRRIHEITKIGRSHITEHLEDAEIASILLRLWSGCVMAAKTIAHETRSGPNTPEMRGYIFKNMLDPICLRDPIFSAGIEAAPAFKELRKEPYSFDGIPTNSVVKIHLNPRTP